MSSPKGLAPWHLWGNTITVPVAVPAAGGAVAITPNTQQLAKGSYRRPENWRFFFAATWVFTDGNLPNSSIISALYSLIIGVGRSQITIPNFCVFNWVVGTSQVGPISLKWTTQVQTPILSDVTGATFHGLCDQFCAQDWNLQAVAEVQTSANPASNIAIEMSAAISPSTHIRPGWYDTPPRFDGNEDGEGW
jgi:hypothetical protein